MLLALGVLCYLPWVCCVTCLGCDVLLALGVLCYLPWVCCVTCLVVCLTLLASLFLPSLVQIEQYSGIIILATNRHQDLDEAMHRR